MHAIFGFLVFLLVVTAITLCLRGLINKRRSLVYMIAGLVVSLITGLGAYYAWFETKSLAWTLGYASIFVIALISCLRQWVMMMRN